VKRVMATLGTAAMAGVLLFGTATEAGASQIRSSGPYSTLSACNYGRQDLLRFGTGVSGVQACRYQPAYTDDYGRSLRAGYYFNYLLN
jgi:hypothetical protein